MCAFRKEKKKVVLTLGSQKPANPEIGSPVNDFHTTLTFLVSYLEFSQG